MPRRNRVTPSGELIDLGRGTFMGNRGCLHDDAGRIVRPYRGRRWIICALEFKGRRLQLAEPGCYTLLFFLDEATALAAGHRPCGECRRDAFRAFVDTWTAANPDALPGGATRIDALDRVLHRQRTAPPERAPLDALPDGAFVRMEADPRSYLVLGGALLPWTAEGYGMRIARPSATVEVLTPPSVIHTLRAGYRPALHSTAAGPGDIDRAGVPLPSPG